MGTSLEHYKEQDVEKLLKDINESSNSGFNLNTKDFLDDRNKDWIGKIAAYSKEKSTFYGVGAGHLGGENGILNLLKLAGYKIKAIE
jgi:uncharacterized protein